MQKAGIAPVTLFERSNLVVDQSADASAAMANKFGGFSVSHAYFEFATEAAVFDNPAPEDTTDSVVTSAISPRDILRCPILTPPGVGTSDVDKFAANELTFFASTSAARLTNGARKGFVGSTNFVDGVLIGGACLIVSKSDQISDILFARIKFGSPIEKAAGFEIDIQWKITFTSP